MNVRKILFLTAVVSVLTLFNQSAFATLQRILPDSSHHDGSVFYDKDTGDQGLLSGRIDFAVYDTDTYADEFIGDDGYEKPGDGQFIYAYQIFNDYETSEAAIGYFAVFGIDESLLDESSIMGIESQNDNPDDDSEEGVAPSDSYFDGGNSKVVWEFENGYIEVGDHSWLLVFSSDQDWIRGDYEIRSIETEFPVDPGGEIPEPVTILLLGTGGAMLLAKRKKLRSLR